MKRLTVALAAIGLTASCGAFAAFPANTDPTLVAVPQLPGGFVIGLTGIYMQPSASNGDLDFANVISPLDGTTVSSTVEQVDPSYTFGGGINVGYIFPGTGNDVNLSYLYLNTDDTDNLSVDGVVTGISPLNSIFLGDGFSTASSKAEYTLNQVDLTFGQYINVGCRLVLHPFAGARFASVERELDSSYVAITADGSVTDAVDEDSDFSGIGPLAGIDASYYIWNGIGVVGHFDTAVLIGSIDSSLNETGVVTDDGTVITFNNNINADNTNRVVPVVDAALGLDYTWLFNNADNSDLTLEIGYKVTNYFNAIDRVNEGGFFDAGDNATTSSDLGLNGPYVSLTLHA